MVLNIQLNLHQAFFKDFDDANDCESPQGHQASFEKTLSRAESKVASKEVDGAEADLDLEEFKKFAENAEELKVVGTKQKAPVSRKNTSEGLGEERQQLKMHDENKKSVETDVVNNNPQATENSFDEQDQAKNKTVKGRKSKAAKVEKTKKLLSPRVQTIDLEAIPSKKDKRVSAPARIKANYKKNDNKVRLLAPFFGYFRGKLVCLFLASVRILFVCRKRSWL